MKILAISDQESRYIWEYFDRDRFKDVDLVISCGDLKSKYLSFLVTLINSPLLYVHGNHDKSYLAKPPEGCTLIEDDIYVYKGIRILGLGGSYKYNNGPFQYTEAEMQKRVRKLKRTLKKHNGFDILVGHSPAFSIGDGKDLPHKGFQAFVDLINEYNPSYFIHGHQHLNYDRNSKRIMTFNHTTIINAYEYHMFNYEPNGKTLPQPEKPKKFTLSSLLK